MDGRWPVPSTTKPTLRATEGGRVINKANIPSRCKALWLRECTQRDLKVAGWLANALHVLHVLHLPTRSGLPVWQYLVSTTPLILLQLLVLISCSPLAQLRKFCVASLVLLFPVPRARLQHPRSLLSLSATTHTASSSISIPDRSTQVCKPFETGNYSLQAGPRSSTSSSRPKGRPLQRRRRRREGR
jgi:hypothetical protein